MNKFERFNTSMRYIQNDDRFTICEISETFNISRSTTFRDIQAREGMGIPFKYKFRGKSPFSLGIHRFFPYIHDGWMVEGLDLE